MYKNKQDDTNIYLYLVLFILHVTQNQRHITDNKPTNKLQTGINK